MLRSYSVLSQEELEQIVEQALKILETAGVEVNHPVAKEKMDAAGAQVGKTRIYIPSTLVEKCLSELPRELYFAGRTSEFDVEVKIGELPRVRAQSGCIRFSDSSMKNHRPLDTKDCMNIAKLEEALENIDFPSIQTPQDKHPYTYDVWMTKDHLQYCRKHFWLNTVGSKNVAYQMKLLETVAGSKEEVRKRPMATGIVCIIAPLRVPYDEIDRLITYGDYGVPVKWPVLPMMGANGPYSKAAYLSLVTAEVLAQVCLTNVIVPGTATFFYAHPNVMDMTSGAGWFSTPETLLSIMACAQIARHLNMFTDISQLLIPSPDVVTAVSQYPLSLLSQALSIRGGFMGMVGSMESGNIYCPELAVIANELVKFIKHMLKGFEITSETLDFEAVLEGIKEQHFLGNPNTFRYMRREMHFKPSLFEWQNSENWIAGGQKSLVDNAYGKYQDIIRNHEVPQLPDEVIREMQDIAEAAEKELGVQN